MGNESKKVSNTLGRQNKIYNYYATFKTIKNQRIRILIIRNTYSLGLTNPISLFFIIYFTDPELFIKNTSGLECAFWLGTFLPGSDPITNSFWLAESFNNTVYVYLQGQ